MQDENEKNSESKLLTPRYVSSMVLYISGLVGIVTKNMGLALIALALLVLSIAVDLIQWILRRRKCRE